MLEVCTVRSPSKADQHAAGFVPTSIDRGEDNFMVDDDDSLLLDYIDFTCRDVPSFFDDIVLPDLETDSAELLAEFDHQTTVISAACQPGGAAQTKPPDDDKLQEKSSPSPGAGEATKDHQNKRPSLEEEEGQKMKNGGDEVLSAVTMEDSAAADTKSSASAEGQSEKKTSNKPSRKNSHGNKKKVKVDWTPELHRRFVQAVEQLGIDKAVPSRILEIMGIERLTRHNVASHLQKYRSQRKHLMAREAERQMYAAAAAAAATGGQVAAAPRTMKYMPAAAAASPWVAPTIGFPPPFGPPLHVWGHPPTTVEAAPPPMLPVWPRHLAPLRPLPPWAPAVVDPAYWHHQQYNDAARKWDPRAVTQGTPCGVPPQMPPPAMLPRFPAAPPPVPGVMPHPMYRPIPPPPHSSKLGSLQLQLDAHPSKESIDEAIGGVLVKPWLPLPLGLKPPSLDSVMSELHKQGIAEIPPAATGGAS